MNKKKDVNYSVSGSLATDLEKLSKVKGVEPESLLCTIVERYLLENVDSLKGVSERRISQRLVALIPAMVRFCDPSDKSILYQSVEIKDLSSKGALIIFLEGTICGRVAREYKTGFSFDLLFSFPGSDELIELECSAMRVVLLGDELQMGVQVIKKTIDSEELDRKILALL